MSDIQDPKRPLGDTPSPAGFPLGSRQSRVAARAKMEARGLAPSQVMVFCGHEKNLCHCAKCEEYMRVVHADARKPRPIPEIFLVGVDADGHCCDFKDHAASRSSTATADGCSETFSDGTTIQGGKGELLWVYEERLKAERERQKRKSIQ